MLSPSSPSQRPVSVGRRYVHLDEFDAATANDAAPGVNNASGQCANLQEFEEAEHNGPVPNVQDAQMPGPQASLESTREEESCSANEWLHFFTLGLGPGYVMLDATFVQVPWFQDVQPEGLKLSSHMTFIGALALGVTVPLYLILQENTSYSYTVPVLSSSSCVLALFSASSWPLVVGDTSLAILLGVFLSSAVGCLQTVVILPWIVESVKPRLISAVLSGSNVGALMAAALSFIQAPGKQKRFSPTVFFTCMAIPLVLPIFAYCRIKSFGVGLLTRHQDQNDFQSVQGLEAHDDPVGCANSDRVGSRGFLQFFIQRRCARRLCHAVFPAFWRKAIWLCVINSFLQIVCWSALRAILPFAAANVSMAASTSACNRESGVDCQPGAMGGEALQYSIELSMFGVAAGSFCSTWHTSTCIRDLVPYVGVFAALGCAIFSAACGWRAWQHESGGMLLVFAAVAIRFVDGFVSPLLFRIVAIQFPAECESVSKWIAVVEKCNTLMATSFVCLLVEGSG